MTETYGTEFFAGRSHTVTASAAIVVPAVCELLSPRSMLDVGCGKGEWLQEFRSCGVEDVVGVDIAAPDEMWYFRRDLTEPLEFKRTFDLVVCLEVGEHLPPEAAETLVESCVHHSNTVLFSAAVPGQEGKGHINCQPHEYWHAYFSLYEFDVLDVVRPRIQHPQVSAWYRDNIFLYVHGSHEHVSG